MGWTLLEPDHAFLVMALFRASAWPYSRASVYFTLLLLSTIREHDLTDLLAHHIVFSTPGVEVPLYRSSRHTSSFVRQVMGPA